ncbi:hypothetical protein JTE90_021639 [Oedothorax gibbosus]|uniref:Uncharacterized protein n=1 Tax=Oedothorax gibbosus TaxID=931172 RepID=A0AAV6VQR6_9ARAC|nr:hypothetical protein JTE90_021639 [Oedothorax gibbosus]
MCMHSRFKWRSFTKCYLYLNKESGSTSALSCDLNLYVSGAATAYGLVMAIYHGYGTVVASRDSHIGRTMWVMPWLLLNGFVMVLMFICACVYSLGLHITCTEVSKAVKTGCSSEISAFLSTAVAEGAVWVSVALWVCLIGIEGIRLKRNRRAISREVYVDPTTSDVVSIGNVVSTA